MEKITVDKFLPNTSILLNDTFLKELRRKCNTGEKIKIKQNFKGFRRLDIVLELCKRHRIDNSELEKNIISYRTNRGRVTINNPILPIKVTPIFDMLIAHGIGDGHCTQINGRISSFVYRQNQDDILRLFNKKVENVFGTLDYESDYFFDQKHIYLPAVLSHILYSFYFMKPKDFLENNAELPNKLLKHSNEHLLAVLIAFILDEGSIDSSNIVIGLQNKRLLSDLKIICKKLNYKNVLKLSKKGSHHLYILSEGVKKFWEDYNKLKKKYPCVSLDYKEKQIEDFILRKNKKWKSLGRGETKNKIIDLLKESDKTVKEISSILKVSRQGTKYHLNELRKLDIVESIGVGYAGSHMYKLKKYVKLPKKKKGRSLQYGFTKKNIINLLSKDNLSTKELSDKLKIDRGDILHHLVILEREKKVKRVGKRIHKTRPSVLWGIN